MKRLLSLSLVMILCLATFLGACASETIKIHFLSDGKVYESIEFDGKSQISMPEAPTKEGYTFEGWYFDSDVWVNKLYADYFVNSPATEDVFVYAKWVKKSSNSGGGNSGGGNSDGGNSGGGNSGGGNSFHNEVVKLLVWNSGWGIDGYQAIVDAFNEKSEAQELGITVELEHSYDQTYIAGEFVSGTSDYDVFVNPIRNTYSYAHLEPLDSLLNQRYGNEAKTLRQKFQQNYLDMMEYNGSIGMLPVVSSVNGIVYNKALFAEGGFAVPRTTDELADLVKDPDFNTTAHKAWIHFADGLNGYYPYVMDVWTAQYMGYTNYYKLTKLQPYTDYNGNVVGAGERSVLSAEDGRYETIKVLDDVLSHASVHSASNAQNFTTAQTAFLNGQAMMMVNGNWLGQEMQKNNGSFDGEKFGMMKTPIISSIINNLKDDSIRDDAELCAVIDAIDAGKTFAEAGLDVTEADYNRIVEARGMMTSGGCTSGMYIANYSNEKDAAKEFIKYFYSDEGAKIWASVKKSELAVDYSNPIIREQAGYYDGWSTWDKEVDALYKATTHPIGTYRTRSKIFVANGQNIFLNVDCITPLTSTNSHDIKTADQLWEGLQSKLNSNWEHWLSAANAIN